MKTATDLFLDAVDSVLNSNTFLLKLEGPQDAVSDQETIRMALLSNAFDQALYQADIEREWHIFHDSDVADDELLYTPLPFNKNENTGGEPMENALLPQFLEALLVAGNPAGFYSPYSMEKRPKEAKAIVNGLLEELSIGSEWRFYQLEKSCLFLPFDPATEVVFWDNTPSDTLTAMLGPDCICFLITNGAA